MQSNSPLSPASTLAQPIAHLMFVVGLAMLAILLLVTVLVCYAAFRYRRRPGAGDPPQNFGTRKLEIAWTVVPLLVLIYIFTATLHAMHGTDPAVPPGRQPDLVIVGHQWWWEARYTGSHVVAANEIHIPAGKAFLVQLESADVIHDWWVPRLGRKMDAIPGHPNLFWLKADSPGFYTGTCAEYCGDEHAWMRIGVVAESEPAFEQWSHHQLETAAQVPASGDAAKGAALFQQMTCGNCHIIAGTSAASLVGPHLVGPDLTHIASRRTLAAGRFQNTPENLSRWLADPQAIKPGCHMPNFQLTDPQVHQLTAYLETLQ